MYRGLGDCFFEDISKKVNLETITYRPLSWGTALADIDNDGDLDLVIMNGHIYPQINKHPEIVGTYEQRNLLLENQGGKFVDVTAQAGPSPATVP